MLGLKAGTVKLVPYMECWIDEYVSERDCLQSIIGPFVIDIQHVGSTSIIGCYAKPIIDLNIAVNDLNECDEIVRVLSNHEYEYRGNAGIPGRHFFVKGPRENRTHHIHVVEKKSIEWENQIYFRDYLRSNPNYIAEYNKIKIELAERYPNDRDSYTNNKSAFIESIIKKAKIENGL